MSENRLLKVLCSLPILLIALYYIPFLGVCLLLFRLYLYRSNKQKTPILLIICGGLILIPQAINYIMTMFNIVNVEIPYLNTILSSDIYEKLLGYSKLLITVGIIFLILSVIVRNIFNKVSNKLNSSIRNYMQQDLQKDYEIRKENELKMQEKREKAKNTHIVYCPYCGSDNMLTEQTGTCKFCRRKIEYKN